MDSCKVTYWQKGHAANESLRLKKIRKKCEGTKLDLLLKATQKYGQVYDETFTPVEKHVTIRVILSLVARKKMKNEK